MKNYQPKGVRVTTRKTVTFLLTCIMLVSSAVAFAQTAPHAPKRHTVPLKHQQLQKQKTAPANAFKASGKARPVKPKLRQQLTKEELQARLEKFKKQYPKTFLTAKKAPAAMHAPKPKAPGTYTYSVTSGPGNTYGYDIFSNGKRIIRQNNVPGMGGNKKFTTREDAEKVARLVTDKMQGGKSAGVTPQEVKSLNLAVN